VYEVIASDGVGHVIELGLLRRRGTRYRVLAPVAVTTSLGNHPSSLRFVRARRPRRGTLLLELEEERGFYYPEAGGTIDERSVVVCELPPRRADVACLAKVPLRTRSETRATANDSESNWWRHRRGRTRAEARVRLELAGDRAVATLESGTWAAFRLRPLGARAYWLGGPTPQRTRRWLSGDDVPAGWRRACVAALARTTPNADECALETRGEVQVLYTRSAFGENAHLLEEDASLGALLAAGHGLVRLRDVRRERDVALLELETWDEADAVVRTRYLALCAAGRCGLRVPIERAASGGAISQASVTLRPDGDVALTLVHGTWEALFAADPRQFRKDTDLVVFTPAPLESTGFRARPSPDLAVNPARDLLDRVPRLPVAPLRSLSVASATAESRFAP